MSSNKQKFNFITNEFNKFNKIDNYRNDCPGPNSNYIIFGNNKNFEKSCYIHDVRPSPDFSKTKPTRNRSTSVRIKKRIRNAIPDRSNSICGSRRRRRLRSYSYDDDYDHDKNHFDKNNNNNNFLNNNFSPNFNVPSNDRKIKNKTKTNSCKYNYDTKFKDDTCNADEFQASGNIIIKRVNGEGKKSFRSSVSFVKGVG